MVGNIGKEKNSRRPENLNVYSERIKQQEENLNDYYYNLRFRAFKIGQKQ